VAEVASASLLYEELGALGRYPRAYPPSYADTLKVAVENDGGVARTPGTRVS